MTEEQFKRLPKFAQEEIVKLRRIADGAKNALSEHVDNQTPSKVFYEDYFWDGKSNQSKRYFVQTEKIRFTLGGGEVSFYLTGDGIQVLWSRGDFAIIPRSGNVFNIVELKKGIEI